MTKIKINSSYGLAGCLVAPFLLFLLAEMFEFSLEVWFGKDIPWYWDYVCGFLLSECLWLIWIISIIVSFVADNLPLYP